MTKSNLDIAKISLIGIGLIGSSLARVIRQKRLAKEISISTRSAKTLNRARELNLGDSYSTNPAESVNGADFVIICVPLGAVKSIAQKISLSLKPGTIISDVGSSKQAVIKDMKPYLPKGVHFVPGHPVAGTEHSGPDAGSSMLFKDRWAILTPLEETSTYAIQKVQAFWQECGSMVEIMDAEHHDHVLAITSHLPQLIAYCIVDTATNLEEDLQGEVIKFSAAGFRDFTRLAASDPIMWRDICLKNREAILDVLSQFSEDLTALRRSIRRNEGMELEKIFQRTRKIRTSIIDAKQA
uniref:prephenate dehydrogenase n=1 Tax=uncultured nuHF1 cluster bacterium HF0770_35I22 TaxID=723586 RepID=E7C7P9_9BACT|nr:prephenate dehydrogenase [uncultured nuHF1 cluster bacterium HF0770_35I22]